MKQNTTARVLSALLASLMLITAAAGCAEQADNAPDNESIQEATVAEEEEEVDPLKARLNVKDDLPDQKFDGYGFKLVIDGKTDHYYIEEDSGDVVDTAVVERNRLVSERFDCDIVIEYDSDGAYTEVSSYINRTVTSADDAFDLICHHVVDLGSLVLNNVFFNQQNLDYINFEKPWWSKSTTEDLTYAGKTFISVGDYALSAIVNTYCVYYNRVLGENYQLPEVFDIVNSGEWTIDRQIELTKDIYEDLNANGKKDEEDFYGFTSDASSNINVYLWAFENPIIKKAEDGTLEFAIDTARMPDIVTKIVSMFDEQQGCFTHKDNNHHGSGETMFYNRQAVFTNGLFGKATGTYRDFEDKYSIIPYPKWEESQQYYHTQVDGNHHALAISTCEQDLETVAIITEALNAESYKHVVPAYYDIALKVKGVRDDESIAILDMLLENRVFDFGYVYDRWQGASFWLQNLVQERNTNWASFYARKAKGVTKQYNKTIEFFEELDG